MCFGVPPTRRGHSKTSWSGHGPDTRTLLRLSAAGSYQDVLMFGKVNVKGGLTGGCAHCVITTTFAKCGVVTARQGFAGAANAPLTGFHSTKDPLGLAVVVRQFQS